MVRVALGLDEVKQSFLNVSWISLVQLLDIIEWHPKICWIDQACSDSTAVTILFLETYGESPNPEVGGDNDVGLGLDAPLQSDVQLFQTPVTATCGVGWGLLQLYKRLV